ncbi:MAG: hypothetical protein GY953_03115, partial [bacterium]|nr:hypothetical protein [bacterium]
MTLVGLDLLNQQVLREEDGENRFEQSTKALRSGTSVWAGRGVGRAAGDELRLTINDRSEVYHVRGVLPSIGQENLVVMDIGAAQRALGKTGKLDRIEVRLPQHGDVAEWARLLRAQVPEDVELQPQGAATEANRKMLAAFRWNLRVLSYIA